MIKITDKEGKTLFLVPDDGAPPIKVEDIVDKKDEESKEDEPEEKE